ncbi:MAG: ferrochelatase [Parvularculaceae bacterium]
MNKGLETKGNAVAGRTAAADRLGVLLVNLGTPSAPTSAAVRRFLAEFLSDPRVVDYPRLLWLPILYGLVLTVRPPKTARSYAKVWRTDTDESPLRYFTRRQAENLRASIGDHARVDWAMRYGAPSIAERLAAFREEGVDRVLVVPLYPQYSKTTTASVEDAVAAALRSLQWAPKVKTAGPFFAEPAYIEALAAQARASFAALEATPESVVLSFHGLPRRLVDAGDPYLDQCKNTAAALRTVLGWSERFAPIAFQSRFGREEWLSPSTEETLLRLAREGARRVAVMTPGFVADCLETLEEIAIAGREAFLAAGGETFTAIPCLNDAPATTSLLQKILARETADWS